MDKPYHDAYQLIQIMTQNHYQWGSDRTIMEKSQTKGGVYEVSSLDQINAKVEALTKKIENLTTTPAATVAAVAPTCDLCGVHVHVAPECPLLTRVPADQVNYAQGNP